MKFGNFFGTDQMDGLANNNNNSNNNNNNTIVTTTTTGTTGTTNKLQKLNNTLSNNPNANAAQEQQIDVEPMSTTPPPTTTTTTTTTTAGATATATATKATATTAVAGTGKPLSKPVCNNTAAVGIDGELATVVNIDVFDDQLSLSSISTNSRLSLEGPASQSSPPLSLSNGLMETNLMHFSESAALVSIDGYGGGPADANDSDAIPNL